MILVSEVRCSDCFNEFKDGPRYGVIKEDTGTVYNEEERLLGAHMYAVLVCPDCAGWYADAILAQVGRDD